MKLYYPKNYLLKTFVGIAILLVVIAFVAKSPHGEPPEDNIALASNTAGENSVKAQSKSVKSVDTAVPTKPESITPLLTEDQIKELILKENPALLNDTLSDFEKVNILREWVFKTIPAYYGTNLGIEKYAGVSSSINIPFNKRFRIYQNGEAGAWCSGSAAALLDTYRLFGYETYEIDYGEVPASTHAIVLVVINYNGKKILSVQGGYLNFTLVDSLGNPLDYFEILQRLLKKEADSIYISNGKQELKPILYNPSDIKVGEKINRITSSGNMIVLEKFIPTDFEKAGKIFLAKTGYPENLLYLQLFPFNAWAYDYNGTQKILNKARELTGTWCYDDGCHGLSEINPYTFE